MGGRSERQRGSGTQGGKEKGVRGGGFAQGEGKGVRRPGEEADSQEWLVWALCEGKLHLQR